MLVDEDGKDNIIVNEESKPLLSSTDSQFKENTNENQTVKNVCWNRHYVIIILVTLTVITTISLIVALKLQPTKKRPNNVITPKNDGGAEDKSFFDRTDEVTSLVQGTQNYVKKAKRDERTYRYITLSNKLEVLLVSDPSTDVAAASMSVGVGSLCDPEQFAGLAHFLEHMLFLGSEKFPDEDQFAKIISQHGGFTNAYTVSSETNYHFNIGEQYLKTALKVWSQFFVSPLLTKSAIEREVNAVNSEHEKNINNDAWRFSQLLKSTSSASHPYHKFATDKLGVQYILKPIAKKYTLEVFWFFPLMRTHFKIKPLSYIASLINEGKSSLLSNLRKKKWADNVAAGEGDEGYDYTIFSVYFSLTELGVTKVDEILLLLFELIGKMRQEGAEEWRWRELQKISQSSFDYQEKTDPSDYVVFISNAMQQYPRVNILTGSFIFENYEADVIRNAIDMLTPERMVVMVGNPSKKDDFYTKEEHIYKTKYTESNIRKDFLKQLGNVSTTNTKSLSLPLENQYISTDFSLSPNVQKYHDEKSPSTDSKNCDQNSCRPKLLESQSRHRVWVRPDRYFGNPHIDLTILIDMGRGEKREVQEVETPSDKMRFKRSATSVYTDEMMEVRGYDAKKVNVNSGIVETKKLLRQELIKIIYANVLSHALVEKMADASVAGYSVDFDRTSTGVSLNIRGYSEKFDKVLKETLDFIRTFLSSEENFENFEEIVQSITRGWENFPKQQPYEKALFLLKYTLREPVFTPAEFLQELHKTESESKISNGNGDESPSPASSSLKAGNVPESKSSKDSVIHELKSSDGGPISPPKGPPKARFKEKQRRENNGRFRAVKTLAPTAPSSTKLTNPLGSQDVHTSSSVENKTGKIPENPDFQKSKKKHNVTIQEVKDTMAELFQDVCLETLIYGNIDMEHGKRITSIIEGETGFNVNKKKTQSGSSVRCQRKFLSNKELPSSKDSNAISTVIQLKDENENESNSACILNFQIGPRGTPLDVRLQLLNEIIQLSIFDELRTKQQLGYIVRSQVSSNPSRNDLLTIVQSPVKDANTLSELTMKFFSTFEKHLNALGKPEFENRVKALARLKERKLKSPSEEIHYLLSEIVSRQYEFNKRFLHADEFKKVTKQEIIDLFKKHIFGDGEKKILAIETFGKDHTVPKGGDKKVIHSMEELKQLRKTLKIYPHRSQRTPKEDNDVEESKSRPADVPTDDPDSTSSGTGPSDAPEPTPPADLSSPKYKNSPSSTPISAPAEKSCVKQKDAAKCVNDLTQGDVYKNKKSCNAVKAYALCFSKHDCCNNKNKKIVEEESMKFKVSEDEDAKVCKVACDYSPRGSSSTLSIGVTAIVLAVVSFSNFV